MSTASPTRAHLDAAASDPRTPSGIELPLEKLAVALGPNRLSKQLRAVERPLVVKEATQRLLFMRTHHLQLTQHAPDEHMLAAVAREGLMVMTGLFWDLGEPGRLPRVARRA